MFGELITFVIKSDNFTGFFICKNILNKIIVYTMTTTLNTSCSENTMVSSARRGVSASMYFSTKETTLENGQFR